MADQPSTPPQQIADNPAPAPPRAPIKPTIAKGGLKGR